MTRWANHVVKLGPYINHQIVLLPVHGVATEKIVSILSGSFSHVYVEKCFHTEMGWPVSCNKAFETMAWAAFQKYKVPFLWMEPDAVPIQRGWLNDIEAEYKSLGRPFMGDFVEIAGIMPNGVNHMSGVAVYPPDLPRLAPSIFNNDTIAWDIASGNQVTRQMARTNLIQHDWVPTKQWRRDKVDASCVKEGAVIYHPDKLGVLFNDGLSPNGVQGDPATGVALVERDPHETKDKPNLYKETAEMLKGHYDNYAHLDNVIQYAKQSTKNKKEVLAKLIEAGILKAPKAKKVKRTRNKVRNPVEVNTGAGAS
jgi:hypothetical protein